MATETPTRDLRSYFVGTDDNGASCRLQLRGAVYVHRNWMFVKVGREAFALSAQQQTTKFPLNMCDAPTSRVKCDRVVAVAIASLLLCVSRHACADRPMIETLKTIPTSVMVKTGNPLSVAMVTITFVDVDVNNAITWILIASSVCEINKTFLLQP